MLEYSVSWLCDSLVGGSLCSWGAKFPTVTYLPRATATARHRVTDNFHVVELFTLLSSLYREPVTFFCLFLEGIPYLHLFFFFNWSPWKLSGPFTDGITKAVFLNLTNSKESAYCFLWQPAFNPGSHVTSNCEHDVQVPLRPKFPPSKSSPSAATGTCQGEWSLDTLLLQEGAAPPGTNFRGQSSLIDFLSMLTPPSVWQ